MEVILKSGTQKEVDDLQEQLDEAHTEISNLKAYIQLKESEILFLKEKVSNEGLKYQLCEKEFSLQRKEFETAIEEAHLSQSTVN